MYHVFVTLQIHNPCITHFCSADRSDKRLLKSRKKNKIIRVKYLTPSPEAQSSFGETCHSPRHEHQCRIPLIRHLAFAMALPQRSVTALHVPLLNKPALIDPWPHQNQIPPITFSPSARTRLCLRLHLQGNAPALIVWDHWEIYPQPKTTSSTLKTQIWPPPWWALPRSFSCRWGLKCHWEPHSLCRNFPLKLYPAHTFS